MTLLETIHPTEFIKSKTPNHGATRRGEIKSLDKDSSNHDNYYCKRRINCTEMLVLPVAILLQF